MQDMRLSNEDKREPCLSVHPDREGKTAMPGKRMYGIQTREADQVKSAGSIPAEDIGEGNARQNQKQKSMAAES